MITILTFKINTKVLIFAAILSVLFLVFTMFLSQGVSAAGNISGTVYIDYNMNGARNTGAGAPNRAVDKGISGVTVTAYDSGGTVRGSATTNASGAYTIAATGTGPYRIEFTTLPTGYSPSQVGTNNASPVRFVPDGNSSGIDLGILSSVEYCQNDPVLVTTCFSGTVAGLSADPVLVSFPYASGTTSTVSSANVEIPTTHALAVPQNTLGAIWGIAHHRRSTRVFSSAFTKRHAGFRNNNKNTASNDPTGEIFVTRETGTAGVLFLNLNSLFGSNVAGNNPHDIADYGNDASAFDAVGKTGLADIDLSENEQTLYAINLQDRKLYAIPLGAGTPAAPTDSSQVTVYNLATLMNPGTGATGCPLDATTPAGEMNRNLRPGGLKVLGNKVYVGLTCTAQSTQNAAQLRAFVYDLNPAGAGSATQVVNIALNYSRGCVSNNGTVCAAAAWRAWISSPASLLDYVPYSQKYLPQPWLLDIEFDQNNFMMLGLADRTGHQTGNQNAGANTGTVEGVSAGDTLRLSPSGATWTLENNASDGTNTTGGANNGEGPGNGEFYYQEGYTITGNTHSEITLGGLLNIPGYQRLIVSAFDPAPTGSLPSGQNTFRAGGLVWLNNLTGGRARSYQLFNIDTPNTFGKASGIGDVEAFCNMAPIQIGNRIWNDTNSNGIQDAGENGIQSVTVQLWADTDANGIVDTQVGTAVTDASGNYAFGGISNTNMTGGNTVLPSTAYEVRIPSTNFGAAQPLNGFAPTGALKDPSANGTARDSNGIVLSGSQVITQFTTGVNGQNNHTFDFGFKSAATGYSVGNRVWFDTDNDGIIDVGEVGISGVSVSLFLDANGDGAPDTPGTPVGTVTTDSGGYYRFDGLSSNNYVLRINPSNFAPAGTLAGYQNTAGNNTGDVESSGAASNAENGINPAVANSMLTNGILSNSITLAGAAEPLAEADVPATGSFAGQGSLDSLSDMTVDFGFYRLTLSGTVWHDTGNGVPANLNNGILNAGEPLLSGFTIQLFNSANIEIPVGPDGILGTADDAPGGIVTDASGNYNFRGLAGGVYRVVLNPTTAFSSTPTETDPNNNGDNNDNGFPDNTGLFPNRFITGLLNLTAGSPGSMNNNSVNNGNGSTTNPTIDFGLLLAPTAVKIDDLKVLFNGGAAELSWTTGSEAMNLGFNVYRQQDGQLVRVTNAFIPGTALRNGTQLVASGNAYSFIDRDGDADDIYYLEDIDLKGNTSMHGPFQAASAFESAWQDPISQLVSGNNEPRRSETSSMTVPGFKNPDNARNLNPGTNPSSGGLKIFVNGDGWSRIPFSQLQSAGFDIATDPANWNLAADGGKVPMLVSRANGGAIEFFGRGADLIDTGDRVYYLYTSNRPGERLPVIRNGSSKGKVAESYRAMTERKNNLYYISGILNGEADNWFGELITQQGFTEVAVQVNDPVVEANDFAALSVKIQGYTGTEHLVEISINGKQVGIGSLEDQEARTFEFKIPMSYLVSGENRIGLRSLSDDYDLSFVDRIILEYAREFKAVNDRIIFTVPAGRIVKVSGFSTERIRLFGLDPKGDSINETTVKAESMGNSEGFVLSASGTDRQFYALAGKSGDLMISKIEKDHPSKWKDPSNSADLIIITPANLLESAAALGQHRKSEGLNTAVVSSEDIFDEFGSGSPSFAAIKDFLEYAASNWIGKPRYVLLFGDSTFDPRNYLGRPHRDHIPMRFIDTEFMETSSDGWFTDFDLDGMEDIAIGRLPVGTAQEAADVVRKLIRYDRQAIPDKRKALLLTDTSFDDFSGSIRASIPSGIEVTNVSRSEGPDEEMSRAAEREVNAGPGLVSMNGHGAQTFWASNSVFNTGTSSRLTNRKLSVFMMMTCLTGYTHYPQSDSLAESLLKAENGAIAVWASSGLTYSRDQLAIGSGFVNIMYGTKKVPRIGDLILKAKRSSSNPDVIRTWQLIGDPTMRVR